MKAKFYNKDEYRTISQSYSSWMLSKTYFFLVSQDFNTETYNYDELDTWLNENKPVGLYETQGRYNRYCWIGFDQASDATLFKLSFVD